MSQWTPCCHRQKITKVVSIYDWQTVEYSDDVNHLSMRMHNNIISSELACEQPLWGAFAAGQEKEGELARFYVSEIWIAALKKLMPNADWQRWHFVNMRSLPLAPVFQCLFTFTLISTLCWLAEIWQLSRWGATRELNEEFKFQRRNCQLSFLFPPHRQSTPESLLAGCSEQGWETNLRIQTLAIFMLVRGECWGPHTAPPLSFLPHFLLMYFQSLNHDLPKASCPKQKFYESSAVAQYFTLAAQLASKP